MSDPARRTREVHKSATIPADHAGARLDQALAAIWPDFSRSRLTAWIRDGRVEVDGRRVKPNLRLAGGENVCLEAELLPHGDPQPQAIGLRVLHEDPEVLVVDKPAGLVVHPGSGNPDGTLVNALLHFDPELAPLPRAGLVHRLDKETSGCLLVARTPGAHRFLVAAMKDRRIHRRYAALVWGRVIAGGTVDQPMGRHPVDRRRQVVRPDGRRAVTHYRINRHVAGGTLLDVALETGRTHQIRVHLAHIGFPVAGDPVYGRRGAPAGLEPAQQAAWRGFRRQALHARALRFPHPDGSEVGVESPLPEDFAGLLEALDE